MDLGHPLHASFCEKNAQKLTQGACRYCIASEVMHIDF